MRASETELIFDNCRVHESNILGNVGDGFIQAMKVLDGGRISIAALSLGIAAKEAIKQLQITQKKENNLENQFHNSRQLLLNWRIWQLKLKLL